MKWAWAWVCGSNPKGIGQNMSDYRLSLAGWLLSVCLLSACEQKIIQNVNNILPTQAPGISPLASASPLAEPSKRPAVVPLNTPSPEKSPPTAQPSASLPGISLSPIVGPSATPIFDQELERFAYSIPEPEKTKNYNAQNIQAAQALWTRRYDRFRKEPYQVLKMYFDAALIAWHNENLTAKLNESILYSGAPWLFPKYALMDAQAIAKAKEYAIRSYFRGTQPLNQYYLADFQNRTVNIVSKNSRGEYIELSTQDLITQAPSEPKDGDTLKIHVLSSATDKDAEVTLIYKKGWKVDFWTPNVLVVFLG